MVNAPLVVVRGKSNAQTDATVQALVTCNSSFQKGLAGDGLDRPNARKATAQARRKSAMTITFFTVMRMARNSPNPSGIRPQLSPVNTPSSRNNTKAAFPSGDAREFSRLVGGNMAGISFEREEDYFSRGFA